MLYFAASYVLILSGTAHHNGDRVIDLNVADSRTIFYTQSVYRCQPRLHVVCEVCVQQRSCFRMLPVALFEAWFCSEPPDVSVLCPSSPCMLLDSLSSTTTRPC